VLVLAHNLSVVYLRDEAKIKVPRKVPRLHRIFVGSFYYDVGHIVSYVTKIAMKTTDKKTGQIGILINASSLS